MGATPLFYLSIASLVVPEKRRACRGMLTCPHSHVD
jgi:hypothetical protein